MSLRLRGWCVDISRALQTKLRIKVFQGQEDSKGKKTLKLELHHRRCHRGRYRCRPGPPARLQQRFHLRAGGRRKASVAVRLYGTVSGAHGRRKTLPAHRKVKQTIHPVLENIFTPDGHTETEQTMTHAAEMHILSNLL